MNKVCLTGNLVRDIEYRQTPNGNGVVSNCIAVQRDRKEADGSYATDFINFVAWNHHADYLSKYALKGDKLELVGRLQIRKFQDKNDNTQSVTEVIVESIQAIPTAKREVEIPPEEIDEEDDLPF